MRLFTRRRLPEAGSGYAGPPAASMRGRASEIADAGTVPWVVLWEALKLAVPGDDADDSMTELGLRMDDWRGGFNDLGQRMHGVRGRFQVEIRIGRSERGLRGQGVQLTWLRAATPEFAIIATDGALAADDGAVAAIVERFAPSHAWDGTELRGGPEGIAARRPITMGGQQAGWAYDLWLCERIAAELGAPLPVADVAGDQLPYGIG